MCEALNNKVCRKCPKDRDYTRDKSYHLRASAAVGEINLGYLPFHVAILGALHIAPSEHFSKQLEGLDHHRSYVLNRASTKEGKATRKYQYKAMSYAKAQEKKISTPSANYVSGQRCATTPIDLSDT